MFVSKPVSDTISEAVDEPLDETVPSTVPSPASSPIVSPIAASYDDIPRGLRIATGYVWRILVLLAGIYVLYQIVSRFRSIFIPLSLSVLLTALLRPVTRFFVRIHIPKALAALLSILVFAALFVFIGDLIFMQVHKDWNLFEEKLLGTVRKFQVWLSEGPLHVKSNNMDTYLNKFNDYIRQHSDTIVRETQAGLQKSVSVLSKFFTDLLLTFFCTIFLLYDGNKVWEFTTTIIPQQYRTRVRKAGKIGFGALVAYVRATFVVAALDAIVIYIGISLLHVPMAAPLALLVFLGAFIPLVGALVTGALAVVVALATQGVWIAIFTALIIIAAIQIEGHVLQPFLMGRAVELHPLAVILAITAGATLFEIWGAFMSVPLVAFFHASSKALHHEISPEVEHNVDEELL